MASIYLDNNATTPVDPEVLEAMLPYLHGEYGTRPQHIRSAVARTPQWSERAHRLPV